METRTALVCGAGGFIGGHLVKYLKRKGYTVCGVDIKKHEFAKSEADNFVLLDLREPHQCKLALGLARFDEVYQLAADMGGMGFIHSAECEIMHNSALININMTKAAAGAGIKRYFFSSSVCVYRDMQPGEPELTEDQAYPAQPDNEYGWEKLYSERALQAFGRHHDMQVRIARFQNCYGPEGTWQGGREKAPAALCRKVAQASNGGEIEVWGDGSAIRSYTYVDDLVDGIFRLMQSNLEGPVNIGSSDQITVDQLASAAIAASGKDLSIKHIEGPVGVQSRNFSKARIHSLGWRAQTGLEDGIAKTYQWIEKQVNAQQT